METAGTTLLEMEPPDTAADPEALAWLRGNRNWSALASSRFGLTSGAVRFVEGLYAAGAARVFVPRDAIDHNPHGPYAAALIVVLPPEPLPRMRVRNLCAAEVHSDDAPVPDDTDAIFLWWD